MAYLVIFIVAFSPHSNPQMRQTQVCLYAEASSRVQQFPKRCAVNICLIKFLIDKYTVR